MNELSLGQRQRLFTKLLAKLIDFAYESGYELTVGEAHRTEEQAAIYAKQGKGIKRSLHCDRLAIDLNLFKNGVYMESSEDHKFLGKYWESLHPMCRWGGWFGDGNHYSITYDGRK